MDHFKQGLLSSLKKVLKILKGGGGSVTYNVLSHLLMQVGEKRKARRKDEIEESTGEVESPPPAKKKRVTNRAADVGVGGSPAVNSAPSPAVTADVVGKQPVISQRRAATSKGQKKTTQPVVYYPKSLGYADGDGSNSSSEEEVVQPSAEEVVQPSAEEVVQPSAQKVYIIVS